MCLDDIVRRVDRRIMEFAPHGKISEVQPVETHVIQLQKSPGLMLVVRDGPYPFVPAPIPCGLD